MELGRNSPCPCGSGKKYKHCCLSHSQTSEQAEINMLFIRGQQAHSTGRLSEAEGVYSAILRRRPDHPEALHFQGLLYHQSGRHQIRALEGLVEIDRAADQHQHGHEGIEQDLGQRDNGKLLPEKPLVVVGHCCRGIAAMRTPSPPVGRRVIDRTTRGVRSPGAGIIRQK